VGGAIVAMTVVLLRVTPALARGYSALRERATERTAVLERARVTLGSAAAVEDSFALAAREIVALAPKLVAGATATEAAATLSSELSAAAQQAGLRVIGLNALPDSSTGTFRPVVLHAQLEGGIAGLSALLRAVEGTTTVLTVRSLHVLAVDPLEHQPGPEQLRVDLVVAGWRLERAKS
jgi:hypothetical protein